MAHRAVRRALTSNSRLEPAGVSLVARCAGRFAGGSRAAR